MSAVSGGGSQQQRRMFVDLRQEKFQFNDGRRGIRFFLVDANKQSHLAVVGEERDTRDGHYTYRKCDTFHDGAALSCGNVRSPALRTTPSAVAHVMSPKQQT